MPINKPDDATIQQYRPRCARDEDFRRWHLSVLRVLEKYRVFLIDTIDALGDGNVNKGLYIESLGKTEEDISWRREMLGMEPS